MNIGFIGAGKVGFSLGKYFKEKGISVSGYYSRNPRSRAEAAEFTQTKSYDSIKEIVQASDTLFITTSDNAIGQIWDQMKNLNVKNKTICHCSGSITSTVFFNGEKSGAHIYSIHPLYAVSDKYNSWQGLQNASFTVEGSDSSMDKILEIFKITDNPVTIISKDSKALYHCAAATASNLVIGLFQTAVEMLTACGFTEHDATIALLPLFNGNAENITRAINSGKTLPEALTGPIERNDFETVKKHLASLRSLNDSCYLDTNTELQTLYKILSRRLLKLAKAKDSTKDYSELEEVLQ